MISDNLKNHFAKNIYSLAKDDESQRFLEEKNIRFVRLITESSAATSDGENIIDPVVLRKLSGGNNFDIFIIYPTGRADKLFDVCSRDNTLFVTGHCNSNCLMCPSSDYSRKNGPHYDAETLIEMIRHMPDHIGHITITGGEPFMIGKDMFSVLCALKDRFPDEEFLLLTNGRVFADKEYCCLLEDSIPQNTLIGIPVHGYDSQSHDKITQADGSFLQSFSGIKHLLSKGIKVELRIVVSKLNADYIDKIADLIISDFPTVSVVRFMGLEMLGNAAVHRDNVWIPYKEAFLASESAVRKLIHHGIDTTFYNFPLCSVDPEFWMICPRSITDYKIKYPEICNTCSVMDACGGIFAGSYNYAKNDVHPIGRREL